MTLLIRKVNFNNWEPMEWLDEESAPGDCTGDLIPKGCILSFWRSNSEEDTRKIMVALATNKPDFDKVEIALIEEHHIIDLGIEIENTPGETPYIAANDLHVSLKMLTSQKIHLLGLTIYKNKQNSRKLRKEIKSMIQAVASDIDIDKAKDKIKEFLIQSRAS